MKTTDFRPQVTSSKLQESFTKQFGKKVRLERYNREQLEDMRNKLRTRVFQYEGSKGFNDLLHNESYQQDKAMLELLNTRIKEMLGEDIKKLRDKMVELSEGKKGVKIAKHPKGSKKATKDYDGDGKVETPKDEVWGSRAKAAKKAGKPFEESAKPDFLDMDKDGDKKEPMKKAVKDKKVKEETGKFDKTNTTWTDKSGKKHPAQRVTRKTDQLASGSDDAPADKKAKKTKESVAKKGGLQESFKQHVRLVNESLAHYIAEDEEGKAKAITAAGDMVNDFTSWMQRVGQYQTKTMIELADAIKADFGAQEAEAFKQAVAPALSQTLEVLTQQREAISGAVAVLAGEAAPEAPMGMEPGMDAGMEPGMDAAGPDMMNPEPAGDEFGASDAAAGGPETSGRAMRESKEQRRARKLAEAHSIMAKLAK
jgi:hypothetical protein